LPLTPLIYIAFYVSAIVSSIAVDACWCVYLYEAHYFFNPQDRWWSMYLPAFFNSYLISILLIVSYLLRWKKYGKTRLFLSPQTKWLGSLFVLMCITSLYAVWPEKHYEFLLYQFKLLIILALAYKVVDSPDKFEKLIGFYLLGIFYLGWVAYSIGRTGYGRLEGVGMVDGVNANDTAAAIVTAIPLLIFYFIKGKRWQQGLSIFALAFIMNGIILINSRGAFLAIVIGCGYMIALFFLNKQLEIREKRKMFIGLLLGIGLFVYLADAIFWNRMDTLEDLTDQVVQGERVGRTYYWLKTFDLVKTYPFGTGVSGYTFLSPEFLPEYMLTEGRRAVHSTYFQVLAEYGYLGIVLFIGLLLSNFRAMKRVKIYLLDNNKEHLYCQAVAIESSFLCYLVAIIFIDRLYAVILYWPMLFIACFYNIYLSKNDKIGSART